MLLLQESKEIISISGIRLSGTQLLTLFDDQPYCHAVEVLDISNNPNFDVNDLQRLLALFPSLRRLDILRTALTDEIFGIYFGCKIVICAISKQ